MTDDGAPQAQQHLNIMHLSVYIHRCVSVCVCVYAIIDCLLATSTLVGFSFLIIYRRGHSQLIFRTTAHFVIALQTMSESGGGGRQSARVEGVDRVGCPVTNCAARKRISYKKTVSTTAKIVDFEFRF